MMYVVQCVNVVSGVFCRMDGGSDRCEWIALRKAGHVDLGIYKRIASTHLR